LITCFSDFRYIDVFRSFLRSSSTVALPNFVGGTLPKVVGYTSYHACLAPRRLIKFRKVTPTNREVIGTHMLNFKPELSQCSPLKFLGDRVPVWDVR